MRLMGTQAKRSIRATFSTMRESPCKSLLVAGSAVNRRIKKKSSAEIPDEAVKTPAIFQRIVSVVLRKLYCHANKCRPPYKIKAMLLGIILLNSSRSEEDEGGEDSAGMTIDMNTPP